VTRHSRCPLKGWPEQLIRMSRFPHFTNDSLMLSECLLPGMQNTSFVVLDGIPKRNVSETKPSDSLLGWFGRLNCRLLSFRWLHDESEPVLPHRRKWQTREPLSEWVVNSGSARINLLNCLMARLVTSLLMLEGLLANRTTSVGLEKKGNRQGAV